MLQRIYGTAFASQKDLDAHLKRIEEAKQRDHRRLGQQLDLFSLHPIAPGSPVLPPEGRDRLQHAGRLHPQPLRALRLHRGDHAAHLQDGAVEDVGTLRRLPRRHVPHDARRGRVRREADELPGPLLPLRDPQALVPRPADPLRRLQPAASLRAVGHAGRASPACARWRRTTRTSTARRSSSTTSSRAFIAMTREVYDVFGFDRVEVTLQTRPEKFLGRIELWDAAEAALDRAARAAGYDVKVLPGRGCVLRRRRSASTSATSSSARGRSPPCRSTARCPNASSSAT